MGAINTNRLQFALSTLTSAIVLAFLWVMMILLGSITLESFMIYPNIFHNAPERFDIALKFMAVTGPAQYFRPLGMASVFLGLAMLFVGWHVRPARWWLVASVLMILAEGISSMLFFWPRNTIMFVEGTALHTDAALRQTALEFQAWHWARLAFCALSALFVFIGYLKLYRTNIISQLTQKSQ